jgi:hypothetical protein
MSGPRVGLIGARRRRQGLGPFVAQQLVAAGAEIPCLLGTSAESVDLARRGLKERCGIEARGYVELRELLAGEKLDALAVLSPMETHERHLTAALDAGLHVLCDKPLIWDEVDCSARVRQLTSEFLRRGLILVENCQWPHTLPSFDELHPVARRGPLRRFAMHLSPLRTGPSMLPECMPHPLSLLQTLLPSDDAYLQEPRFLAGGAEGPGGLRELAVEFRYCAGGSRVEVRVELCASDQSPRRAGFGINGCWAERLVRDSDYAMCLASGSRWVDLPDPLRALVRGFVAELRQGTPTPARALEIAQRAELLEALSQAFDARR